MNDCIIICINITINIMHLRILYTIVMLNLEIISDELKLHRTKWYIIMIKR